jgi:hypothetical protein
MRTRLFVAAAVAALIVLGTGGASAQVLRDEMRLEFDLSIGQTPIAQFEPEFGPGGGAGWSYLYNTGPLGVVSQYAPLTFSNGQYTGPTGVPVVGKTTVEQIDVTAYPPNPIIPKPYALTFVRPGLGSFEDPSGIERAAIIAYTIQPEDLVAAGVSGPALVTISAYDFAVSARSTPDGMSARIYGGSSPTPLLEFSDDTIPPFPFPAGFRFETSLDPDPIPLGMFNAGDTIYFALGANNLSVVPEPAAASLLAGSALLLVRRRRR